MKLIKILPFIISFIFIINHTALAEVYVGNIVRNDQCSTKDGQRAILKDFRKRAFCALNPNMDACQSTFGQLSPEAYVGIGIGAAAGLGALGYYGYNSYKNRVHIDNIAKLAPSNDRIFYNPVLKPAYELAQSNSAALNDHIKQIADAEVSHNPAYSQILDDIYEKMRRAISLRSKAIALSTEIEKNSLEITELQKAPTLTKADKAAISARKKAIEEAKEKIENIAYNSNDTLQELFKIEKTRVKLRNKLTIMDAIDDFRGIRNSLTQASYLIYGDLATPEIQNTAVEKLLSHLRTLENYPYQDTQKFAAILPKNYEKTLGVALNVTKARADGFTESSLASLRGVANIAKAEVKNTKALQVSVVRRWIIMGLGNSLWVPVALVFSGGLNALFYTADVLTEPAPTACADQLAMFSKYIARVGGEGTHQCYVHLHLAPPIINYLRLDFKEQLSMFERSPDFCNYIAAIKSRLEGYGDYFGLTCNSNKKTYTAKIYTGSETYVANVQYDSKTTTPTVVEYTGSTEQGRKIISVRNSKFEFSPDGKFTSAVIFDPQYTVEDEVGVIRKHLMGRTPKELSEMKKKEYWREVSPTEMTALHNGATILKQEQLRPENIEGLISSWDRVQFSKDALNKMADCCEKGEVNECQTYLSQTPPLPRANAKPPPTSTQR